jgi:UDP-N-acetylglucosamine enolpyruvyl transferase
MASNLTIKLNKPLTGQIDGDISSARPLFWAVATFISEGDLQILNARSETEPLDFLLKFQKLGIPFEVKENTLHVWHENLHFSNDHSVTLENSLQLQLIPLFLKLPFAVSVLGIGEDQSERVKSFVREAKRAGAKIKFSHSNTLTTEPSKIRAGRFLATEDESFNQALVLLAHVLSHVAFAWQL